MVKILGLLDIFGVIVLLLVSFDANTPKRLVIIIAALLCLKGFIFIFDIASILDIGVGILLFLSLFVTLPLLLLLIVAGVLGLKGILSLVPLS